MTTPLNAITIDVEDWVQSVLDPNLPLTDRFVRNTHRVLELLESHGVRGTFFVLGLAAEKAPELVREIQRAGHEVQSHGYGHQLIHTLDRDAFRSDLERSRKLLEDITGQPITGYRAPAFSITQETLWALDVLVECGFRYDSSIVPVKTRRYGIDGASWFPHRLQTPSGYELMEWPVASWQMAGVRRPIGGGGYFRLYPFALIRKAISQIHRSQAPAVIYMHPYELAPEELSELPYRVPWKLRLHQSLGRRGFARKMHRLLTEFRFGPIRSVSASLEEASVAGQAAWNPCGEMADAG